MILHVFRLITSHGLEMALRTLLQVNSRNIKIQNRSAAKVLSLRFSSSVINTRGASSYWKSLKWFSIPASVGFAYIAYLQFRHIQKRERRYIEKGDPQSLVLDTWQVEFLKKLPTRTLSRWWGYLSHLHVPVWMRRPLFGLYVKLYDCDMEEAMIEDVIQFPTFSEFFKRRLRPDARTISRDCEIVSPVDGRVLYFGKLDQSYNMEQVKGIRYSLATFCGPKHPLVLEIIRNKEKIRKERHTENKEADSSQEDVYSLSSDNRDSRNIVEQNEVGLKSQNFDIAKSTMYYCILYLAPGDYHWFHSPTEWTIEHRRHIPGHLFSVSPSAMRSIEGLFNFNERVLLYGHWKYGKFLLGAVGAYNVGSIILPFTVEKHFKSNEGKIDSAYIDRLYGAAGFSFQRGESLGAFDLGSSIVLIFTGPDNLKFHIEPGQRINYGQPILSL